MDEQGIVAAAGQAARHGDVAAVLPMRTTGTGVSVGGGIGEAVNVAVMPGVEVIEAGIGDPSLGRLHAKMEQISPSPSRNRSVLFIAFLYRQREAASSGLSTGGRENILLKISRQSADCMINCAALTIAWRIAPRIFLRVEEIDWIHSLPAPSRTIT